MLRAMHTIIRIPGIRCPKCSHEWVPRKTANVGSARRCPKCFTPVSTK